MTVDQDLQIEPKSSQTYKKSFIQHDSSKRDHNF